jgi:hypothetical protein
VSVFVRAFLGLFCMHLLCFSELWHIYTCIAYKGIRVILIRNTKLCRHRVIFRRLPILLKGAGLAQAV